MATQQQKEYIDSSKYWNFILPIFASIVGIFGLFVLFTKPRVQQMNKRSFNAALASGGPKLNLGRK